MATPTIMDTLKDLLETALNCIDEARALVHTSTVEGELNGIMADIIWVQDVTGKHERVSNQEAMKEKTDEGR